MHIKIINGANLNFLGIREPHIYGNTSLVDLENTILEHANKTQVEVSFFQSNIEGEIINCMQECYHKKIDGIIINPGAFTHYSYAIADAIKSVAIPTIEVHISNIYTREEFRRHSVTANACVGAITGLGMAGYILALDYFKLESICTNKNL
ncbi:type II 3-dehydroquinate dehydratase [Candidatus Epulonipiscium fishelsonii]|uniref:Type II 3-dehydroquinate dehydratase n=1 Tax=Candidatus Epulonipiscium fishelsonii TaxID=77094 RepID=A0ACC8XHP4_9FIRM|nr:type II 3-dehydroquinate dehydratase [Epulopiscium sp. SCG-D08WGA-EpuloA1]